MSIGDFADVATNKAASRSATILQYPINNADQYQGKMTFHLVDEEAERAFSPDFSGFVGSLYRAGGELKSSAVTLASAAVDAPGDIRDFVADTGPSQQSKVQQFYGDSLKPAKASRTPKMIPDQKVTLYLPQAIQIQDAASYDTNVELGSLGGGVASAIAAKQNVGSALEAGASRINSMVRSLTQDPRNISREEASLATARIAANTPSLGFGATISQGIVAATGVTTNPNVRALFRSVPIRNFSFQFTLIPTSQKESIEIREIIKFFRTELYPVQLEAGGVAYGYKFPNRFIIRVSYKNREIPGVKFLPVYLQSFNATYNPNGMGMHKDGGWPEVGITMSFTEGKALNRADVEEGGY